MCRTAPHQYDTFDRLVQEEFFQGNLLTQTKVYLYNGEGELAETALYNGEVSAANEQQRYRYESRPPAKPVACTSPIRA